VTENDPRWGLVVSFFQWFEASKDAQVDEFLRRWLEYNAILKAIAADATVSSQERAIAQELSAEGGPLAWANLTKAIRVLARLAGNEGSVAPDVQA
jgi:hypothetical protein